MSTFDAANIESTSGGAPSFSQGLNVGGSSITTLITMTEYYSQAEEPSSPANGAVWWDGTDAYQYVGGAWRILSVTPPPLPFGGSRGVFASYDQIIMDNAIEYISIATPGNSVNFGDLIVARGNAGTCSNNVRGVFAGGVDGTIQYSFSQYNTIDYITVGTLGNAVNFGNLSSIRFGAGGCSDGTYGVFGGGCADILNAVNTIEYITIATTGNAQDFGDLTVARMTVGSCSDGTYGLFGGGATSTFSSSNTNTIDYVTIATTGNAQDFGDLTVARNFLAGCSNKIRGVFAGGSTATVGESDPYGGSPTSFNTIEYVTIATTGNATDFGDLTVARTALGACSDGTYAVFAGGGTTSSNYVNVIDYVTIATAGNATDFGDLLIIRYYVSGLSGD